MSDGEMTNSLAAQLAHERQHSKRLAARVETLEAALRVVDEWCKRFPESHAAQAFSSVVRAALAGERGGKDKPVVVHAQKVRAGVTMNESTCGEAGPIRFALVGVTCSKCRAYYADPPSSGAAK